MKVVDFLNVLDDAWVDIYDGKECIEAGFSYPLLKRVSPNWEIQEAKVCTDKSTAWIEIKIKSYTTVVITGKE